MVIHLKETAKKMYQKVRCRCKIIVLLTKSTFFSVFFFMFSLHLKLPNQFVFWGVTGGGGSFV